MKSFHLIPMQFAKDVGICIEQPLDRFLRFVSWWKDCMIRPPSILLVPSCLSDIFKDIHFWFSCFSHALWSFGLGVAARLKALFLVFLKRSTASSRGTYLLMVKCWISWTVSRIFGASALDQSIPSIFLYLNIILLECLFIYLTKKAVSRRSPPKSIRTYSIVFQSCSMLNLNFYVFRVWSPLLLEYLSRERVMCLVYW